MKYPRVDRQRLVRRQGTARFDYKGIPNEIKERFYGRNVVKDQEFALALLDGLGVLEAANEIGMDPRIAKVLMEMPAFKVLLARLREEREATVYEDNPDKITESLARGNVWMLREIRDRPQGRDADKLRAALILHEMRPSVQAKKNKMGGGPVSMVFESSVMQRLQDGLRKLQLPKAIEIESKPVAREREEA
jgi:hypothetical protein